MDATARRALLDRVYGVERGSAIEARLQETADRHRSSHSGFRWSERDAWLIAYPDQFARPAEAPLATLADLIAEWNWLTGVHVLPCYPWTSDDGFAVTDYTEIDSAYGTWEDIRRVSDRGTLMLDAVINHMSSQSGWFREFLDGTRKDFFVEQVAGADYQDVVRPRTTPLFHDFDGAAGIRSVWTTFSADQVDLNYANPTVLEEVAEVLLLYCANGAAALRLDAIGFLWKQPGTPSIHLPETHALIALLASVVKEAYPGTVIVSEVNVPHAENVAYLGTATQPESDLIYQFPLAPLTLYAVHTGDCRPLVDWAAGLAMPRTGVSFLNFLASHDGVGVRPAEGLVPSLDPLLEAVGRAGGQVSYRDLPDGTKAPYELNSTWCDLVGGVEPHLATHAVMMAMPGIPLIYAHSLFGSRNDHELYRRTGRERSLNRHKFSDADAVRDDVSNESSRAGRVFAGLRDMVQLRASHSAFHPEAPHRSSCPTEGVIAIERGQGDDAAVVMVNLTSTPREVDAAGLVPLDGGTRDVARLDPWEHRWFARV